jgi:hypothetical protein
MRFHQNYCRFGGETAARCLRPCRPAARPLSAAGFVNFNRKTTDHAVVFLGFIDQNYEEASYSSKVAP